MNRHALLVVIVGLLIAADKEDAAKEDLKKMTGAWTMVSGEQDGKQLSKKTIKAARLRIKGEEHTVKVGDDTMQGTHKLDATKKPKTIDVQDTEGPFGTSLGAVQSASLIQSNFSTAGNGPGNLAVVSNKANTSTASRFGRCSTPNRARRQRECQPRSRSNHQG